MRSFIGFKDAFGGIGPDARSVIGDRNHLPTSIEARRNLNLLTTASHGIGHEVANDLPEPNRIDLDSR